MTNFESKKLSELVLYILQKTGGMDFYHVFKILYFAEMEHLAKWGTGLVPDKFCALKYGPVPTHLYNAVKELNKPTAQLAVDLSEVTHFAGEDAPNILLPKRNADFGYLSRSEIEALDKSINENESLSFGQLVRKSHDAAWKEADKHLNGSNVISPLSMAKVMNADEAMLQYIEDQMQIDSALR